MNPVVRQRLVGTLVLIAMAVVFWPIIFVTPETKVPLVIQPPPPAPRVDETPLPMPASPKHPFARLSQAQAMTTRRKKRRISGLA